MAHPVQLLKERPVLFNSHTNGKVGLNRDADLKKEHDFMSQECVYSSMTNSSFFHTKLQHV